MKKTFIHLSLGLSLFNLSSVRILAQEAPDPYIVSQSIPNEIIPMEECIAILTNPLNSDGDETASDSMAIIHETEQLLQSLQEQFNQLNAEISQLESGEFESLDWANNQLLVVIEQLFEEYQQTNEDFIYLSEEEQIATISNHNIVIEWQAYMQEITAIINQKIADRDHVELEYSQVNHKYNELLKAEEDQKEIKKLYNQCQLYAYSAEYHSPDQILLNKESNVSDYLIQLETYLDQIIPKAYRKVNYDDIYQQFNKVLTDQDEMSSNKNRIVVDSLAMQHYAYAKEINLTDIESLSHQALLDYKENQNITDYGDCYRELIQLKENQWSYIYQINQEAFDKIKDELSSFLNQNQYITDTDIQLLSQFQHKYQVKLVFFDDIKQEWILNSTGTSGYYDQYYYEEFTIEEAETSEELINPTEIDDWVDDVDELGETSQNRYPVDSSNDTLSSLKEQLSNSRNDTQVKDLTVPSSSTSKVNKPPKTINKSKNIELPSTGEKRPLTIGAILLLLFGLVLILTSSYSKRKKKEKSLNIHLD